MKPLFSLTIFFKISQEYSDLVFLPAALKSNSIKNETTVINPPKNMTDFNCVYPETQDQTLSVMSQNEIYFHASEHETVG